MGQNYAYKLLASAKVATNVYHGTQKPTNERQIRPLTVLDDPDQQRQAWNMATAQAEKEGRAVIAKDVKRAVQNVVAEIVEEQEELPEEEPEQPERRIRITLSRGLEYADMAIAQLKSINVRDTQRQAAFNKVTTWIKENR